MALSFDELNKLHDGKRSMSYEKYFGEMELPEEEKKKRTAFSMDLELILIFVLSGLYADYRADRIVDMNFYRDSAKGRFIDLLEDYSVTVDNETKTYVENTIDTFIETTAEYVPFKTNGNGNAQPKRYNQNAQPSSGQKPKGNKPSDDKEPNTWYVSKDRARFDAENEANSVFNREDFRKAKAYGKKNKRWITMKDSRVRRSHNEVDEAVVGINDYFVVNGNNMRYAHDPLAPASEIVNCRCITEYF